MVMAGCEVSGCGATTVARGLCSTHYSRWKRGPGKTIRRRHLPPEARFWSKVEDTSSCWLWTGATNDKGYGQLWVDRRLVYAHRFAYQLLVGPIPEGHVVDHLCGQTRCVRPDHLDAVTGRENLLRGRPSPSTVNARKDRCIRGHPFDEENTRRTAAGARACRTCHRERNRARRLAA